MSRWRWLLLQFTRRLWVRATLFSLLSVAASGLALVAEPFIPDAMPHRIGAGAVRPILDILASSMLAVTTFSLGVMVSAYAAASSSVTPRATRLLMEDSTTQNVLGVFIGSFLFSLTGIVLLSAGAYGDKGRVVLYVASIAVIVLIVLTLLRWVDHLSRFGRVGETTERVEKAASSALVQRAKDPCLGGRPLTEPSRQVPLGARAVLPATVGYVCRVDVGTLSSCAEALEAEVYVTALPGSFVDLGMPLARVAGVDKEVALDTLRQAFTIGGHRSFDQDPRFGLSVLAEIGSRALSPAVNDLGTAIDIIGRAVRVLSLWVTSGGETEKVRVRFPRVHVPPLRVDDLFDDIFAPLARDGAVLVEVHLRLQKALLARSRLDDRRFTASAARHARLALARTEAALAIEHDKLLLREVARELLSH